MLSCALIAVVAADVSHLVRKSNVAPGQEASANILRSESDIQPDGSYNDNGIQAQEAAQIRQLGPEEVAKNAQGSFSWTSPEGETVQISYVADENGYQPQGNLPTPPPIPAAIQKALDWIAAHPQPQEPNKRF